MGERGPTGHNEALTGELECEYSLDESVVEWATKLALNECRPFSP
jgi:hypothetical protein